MSGNIKKKSLFTIFNPFAGSNNAENDESVPDGSNNSGTPKNSSTATNSPNSVSSSASSTSSASSASSSSSEPLNSSKRSRSARSTRKKKQWTYMDFVEKMKQPEVTSLTRHLHRFVQVQFALNTPVNDARLREIHGMINKIYESIKVHNFWKDASQDELDNVFESLEKFIMTKLYTKMFPNSLAVRQRDSILAHKIAVLAQFIEPQHLDIPIYYRDQSMWDLAQRELRNMDTFKPPRDKIVCLLNCCRIIINLMKKSKSSKQRKKLEQQELLRSAFAKKCEVSNNSADFESEKGNSSDKNELHKQAKLDSKDLQIHVVEEQKKSSGFLTAEDIGDLDRTDSSIQGVGDDENDDDDDDDDERQSQVGFDTDGTGKTPQDIFSTDPKTNINNTEQSESPPTQNFIHTEDSDAESELTTLAMTVKQPNLVSYQDASPSVSPPLLTPSSSMDLLSSSLQETLSSDSKAKDPFSDLPTPHEAAIPDLPGAWSSSPSEPNLATTINLPEESSELSTTTTQGTVDTNSTIAQLSESEPNQDTLIGGPETVLEVRERIAHRKRKREERERQKQRSKAKVKSHQSNASFGSADDFLPILIYVLIKAMPPQLCLNIEYIQMFRHPRKLCGEPAYYFTQLVSAVTFIENVEAKMLTIDPQDFDNKYRDAEKKLAIAETTKATQSNKEQVDSTDQNIETVDDIEDTAPGDTDSLHTDIKGQCTSEPESSFASSNPEQIATSEMKGDVSDELKLNGIDSVQLKTIMADASQISFRWEAVEDIHSLTVGEVPGLLKEYKKMAHLLRALQNCIDVTASENSSTLSGENSHQSLRVDRTKSSRAITAPAGPGGKMGGPNSGRGGHSKNRGWFGF